jgi:hypothetical protein
VHSIVLYEKRMGKKFPDYHSQIGRGMIIFLKYRLSSGSNDLDKNGLVAVFPEVFQVYV